MALIPFKRLVKIIIRCCNTSTTMVTNSVKLQNQCLFHLKVNFQSMV